MAKLNELYLNKTDLDILMEEWLEHRHGINNCFGNFFSFIGGSLSLNESEKGESNSTNGFAELELGKIDKHINLLNNHLDHMNARTDQLISENKPPVLTDYDKMHNVIKKLANITEEYREELKQEVAERRERIDNEQRLLRAASDKFSKLDAVDNRFMDFVDNYNKHTSPDKKIELSKK